MKVITKYQCEICNQTYNNEEFALKCEAKGLFDSSKYPAGLMYEYHHNGYFGIFAIPNDVQPSTTSIYNSGHIGETSFWACRSSNFIGDSLGDELCGHTYLKSQESEFEHWIKYHYISDEKVGCDEYNRMVAFLKSKSIQPSYYNKEGKLIIIK